MKLTSFELACLLHHYGENKEIRFQRKMTSGYQELHLIELIDEIDSGSLIMVLKKEKV